MADHEEMRVAEFAFPGASRERFVRAILDGAETATAGAQLEYELDPNEIVPVVGERSGVIDSEGRRVGVIETIGVEVVRAADVDLAFARDDGECFESVADWRAAHVRFWGSDAMSALLGLPDFHVTDDTVVVTERFRPIERLV